jgi:uncharacterized protein with ParB-like and HNH nuclease domain
MEVTNQFLHAFLEGSSKIFVIPVYQRDYAWTRNNCQKLWDDLVDMRVKNRPNHFLGTIVTVSSGFDVYTVIDGQQRLTTSSLFLLALHNYLNNKMDKTYDENILGQQILDYLINKYSADKTQKIKLKPNKQDKEFFNSLFEDKIEEIANSNIINNYNFFYEKISEEKISPRDVFEMFKRIKIVGIYLFREQDDPQLIFESLNSTGVDLNAGDLIRNYILMDFEPSIQENLYKNYWMNIEKNTGDTAEFVRNYLIFKTKLFIKRDNVYETFKKFSNDSFDKNKELILKDLLYFARLFSYIVQINNHPNQNINRQFNKFKKFEFTVAQPYLLDLLNDLEKDVINLQTVIDVTATIESYAFRKLIVDNTTQGLNRFFTTLSKEIKKESNWQNDYVNILNYILLERRGPSRFPSDAEFENSLINKEIYLLKSKNTNYLLESLEKYNSAYPIDLEELTIEHIMPQKLNEVWKKRLGTNFDEIHKKYLHTLGNLSLTSKNSQLSNNSFEEKQKIDFQNSRLKLNFNLDGLNNWNEELIILRAKNLSNEAIKIWKYPTSTYTKASLQEQLYDLSSEENFSGLKPLKIYFENDSKVIEVKTWVEVLREVCKYLYSLSPTRFNELYESVEFKRFFSNDKNELSRHLEFVQSKYVDKNLISNDIITLLSKICERMNIPPESISFSVINNTE